LKKNNKNLEETRRLREEAAAAAVDKTSGDAT
jgi:hypothetical protein